MTWWRNLSKEWKGGIATIAAVVAFTLFCIGASWWEDRDTGSPRRGDPAVYQRIDATTRCDDLQGEFDAADARRKAALSRSNTNLAEENLAYMDAALVRMRQLGC